MLIDVLRQANMSKGEPRQSLLAKIHMYVLRQAKIIQGKPRQPLLVKMHMYVF